MHYKTNENIETTMLDLNNDNVLIDRIKVKKLKLRQKSLNTL